MGVTQRRQTFKTIDLETNIPNCGMGGLPFFHKPSKSGTSTAAFPKDVSRHRGGAPSFTLSPAWLRPRRRSPGTRKMVSGGLPFLHTFINVVTPTAAFPTDLGQGIGGPPLLSQCLQRGYAYGGGPHGRGKKHRGASPSLRSLGGDGAPPRHKHRGASPYFTAQLPVSGGPPLVSMRRQNHGKVPEPRRSEHRSGKRGSSPGPGAQNTRSPIRGQVTG